MPDHQLTHKDHKSSPIKRRLVLMCDGIQSPANIGAIFRLVDAFAVEEIIFGGVNIDLSSSRLRRTARNTYDVVRFRESEHLPNTLSQLHNDGFSSVAIEITEKSTPLNDLKMDAQKVVLILGNERHGISSQLLAIAENTSHIPMLGNNSSMNVAQAAAIAFYELRRG